VFRKAAGDDAAGWDTAGASAEVRPGAPLTETGRRPAVPGERGQSRALDPSSLSAAGACPGGPVRTAGTGHGTGLLSAPARPDRRQEHRPRRAHPDHRQRPDHARQGPVRPLRRADDGRKTSSTPTSADSTSTPSPAASRSTSTWTPP
jgi:hypothetical protein